MEIDRNAEAKLVRRLRRRTRWRRPTGVSFLMIGFLCLGLVCWKVAIYRDLVDTSPSAPDLLGFPLSALIGISIGVQAMIVIMAVSMGLRFLLIRDRTTELLLRLYDERESAPNQTTKPTP